MEEFSKSAGCDEEIINQYHQLISSANTSTLRKIITINSKLLSQLQLPSANRPVNNELDKLFSYIPNVFTSPSLEVSSHNLVDKSTDVIDVDEDDFVDKLRIELDSMGLESKFKNHKKVATQWILQEPKCKKLPDAHLMSKYGHISHLCEIINGRDECVGTMNGCIVNCYRTSTTSRLYPHSDDEQYIDQSSSICSFSLGASRDFKIFEKTHQNPVGIKTFSLNEKSVLIMQPGSQAVTKHKVLSSSNPDQYGLRYSISFRRIIYDDVNIDSHTSSSVTSLPKDCIDRQIDTTVVFGSSISKHLKAHKLAGRHTHIKVINVSNSGAKIKDVVEDMEKFFDGSHEYFSDSEYSIKNLNINSIFISIGTNDIGNLPNGANHLYGPVVDLLKKMILMICTSGLLKIKLVN